MKTPLSPQSFKFNLTATNNRFPIHRPVRFLRVLSATEAFDLAIDGEVLPFRTGNYVRLPEDYEPFQKVEIRRSASAALANNYVELIGADFVFGDDALTFAGSIGITPGAVIRPQVAIRLSSPQGDYLLLADNNVQIFTANADVESVDVWNNSTTTMVRIATATGELSANRGLRVPPQSSRSIRQNGNLYARAIGGSAAVSVNFTSFA